MAEKKVTIVVGKDGKMAMSFDGFSGNSCYDEARKIQAHLKSLGIEVDCESLIPKENSEINTEVSNAIRNS